MNVNNPPSLGTMVADVTAVKAVTDAIPNAGAMTDIKPRKEATPGAFLSPATGAAEEVASDNSANSYGAWVETIASVAADSIIVALAATQESTGTTNVVYDIGIGAAASEVSTGEIPMNRATNTSHTPPQPLPLGIKVSAGDRVAIRARDLSGAALISSVFLRLVAIADLEAYDA